jgi:DNA-binding IscR family transcriptional regulator
MSTLSRHGITLGLRGPSGGYALATDASRISLATVVEILDGPLYLPVACLGPSAEPCPECPRHGCAARRALTRANAAAWEALGSLAISDLATPKSEEPDWLRDASPEAAQSEAVKL